MGIGSTIFNGVSSTHMMGIGSTIHKVERHLGTSKHRVPQPYGGGGGSRQMMGIAGTIHKHDKEGGWHIGT